MRQPPGILYFGIIHGPVTAKSENNAKRVRSVVFGLRIIYPLSVHGCILYTLSRYTVIRIFRFISFSLHYARRLIIATQRLELTTVVEREILFFFLTKFTGTVERGSSMRTLLEAKHFKIIFHFYYAPLPR